MNTRSPPLARWLPLLPYMLVTLSLTCAAVAAAANDTLERVQQRGTLTVGIDRVPPAYAAGKKFRTPEAIDAAVAEQVARSLHVALTTVRNDPESRRLLENSAADLILTTLAQNDPLLQTALIVPTGYSAGPMAIMRSDTTIRQWKQLAGRTVCLAQDGRYVGLIARQFGAIEKVYSSPADSLLALRTGRCDAAVHDNALLDELLKLPEWKKFSARLPTEARRSLVFAVQKNDTALAASLKRTVTQWRKADLLIKEVNLAARNIAFEVYLNQDVPDCH